MKLWLTAAEIAAAGLAGLPKRRESVIRLAAREGWNESAYCRVRGGSGGGFEYSIDIMPVDARTDYVARHIERIEMPPTLAREAATESGAEGIGGAAAQARDARLALLAAADKFAVESSLLRNRADQHFCDCYNGGRLTIAAWIREQVKSLTPRTLKRWRRFRRERKLSLLAVDRAASRRGTGSGAGALIIAGSGGIGGNPGLIASVSDAIRTGGGGSAGRAEIRELVEA